jgi:hypothetical protein
VGEAPVLAGGAVVADDEGDDGDEACGDFVSGS